MSADPDIWTVHKYDTYLRNRVLCMLGPLDEIACTTCDGGRTDLWDCV